MIGKEFVSLSGYVWRETISNGLPVDNTVESSSFSLLESAIIDIQTYHNNFLTFITMRVANIS